MSRNILRACYSVSRQTSQAKAASVPLLRACSSLVLRRFTLANTLSTRNLGTIQKQVPLVTTNQLQTKVTEKQCPGCGADFQKEDPSKPGYLPTFTGHGVVQTKKKREKHLSSEDFQRVIEDLDDDLKKEFLGPMASASPTTPQLPKTDEPSITRTLCQRCFNIVHYNKEPAIWGENAVTDRSYLKFLKKKHNAIVVKVFDIFDFPGSFLEDLEDFTSNVKHVILVANKIDLLPGDINRNRVIDWLRRRSKSMGLTNVSSVHLVSAKKNHGIRELANTIANLREPKDDVYLVGCTNVGKSEIINSLMRVCKGRIHKKNKVTSSLLPGTTIGMLGIPLQRFGHAFGRLEHNEIENPKQFLYDTPGILNKEQLIHFLNHDELRYVIPNKPMKPETFMMTPGRSLLLGGLGRLDYTEGHDDILVTVFSQVLPHFTKIEKADILCDKLATGESTILCPPIGDAERLKRFPKLVEGAEFTLSGAHRTMATMDIVLTSVGWFSITGLFDRATLKVFSPGGIGIRTREPLLPFEFRGQISKYRSNTRKTR